MDDILHRHFSRRTVSWTNIKKKYKSRAQPSKSTKDTQWIQYSLAWAVKGTLLTVSPVCQSRRTVLCAAEVLDHWISCFSDSFPGTDPERSCFSPRSFCSDWRAPSVLMEPGESGTSHDPFRCLTPLFEPKSLIESASVRSTSCHF